VPKFHEMFPELYEKCSGRCHGTGRIPSRNPNHHPESENCPDCQGTGSQRIRSYRKPGGARTDDVVDTPSETETGVPGAPMTSEEWAEYNLNQYIEWSADAEKERNELWYWLLDADDWTLEDRRKMQAWIKELDLEHPDTPKQLMDNANSLMYTSSSQGGNLRIRLLGIAGRCEQALLMKKLLEKDRA
jgi:hypothetical protein